MASGATAKCSVCGKTVAIGFVSQTLIQHENKAGERCRGTGEAPVVSVRGGARSGGAAPKRVPGASKPAKTSPATKGGVTVRKLDVDPEVLKERQERSERMRQERAEAARERNSIGFSYFDEPNR
jgi:hypothetical protein